MSYNTLGYGLINKVLANCDKCSAHGQSNKVITPWGIIKMYHTSTKGRGRFYSISKSKVLPNGGSLKMSTLRYYLGVIACLISK